ncbi:GntR family transcriptional regulator [Aquibacillus kalidii]|uniref:GntR family transcriptional regulator n=1 Tax=Aquibacillus kalidii TaxID=2762597 RepID=UPI001648EAA0|nr:GntR family transcriptional regulator [Aquibacillus kalidii]
MAQEPKYKKIKNKIKSEILEGLIAPNQKISSESMMMERFNVSRHTVRLAVGELVSEGWLHREQGSGTYSTDIANFQDKNHTIHSQKSIAVMTTYISEYIFPTIIRGAESYLSEKGYNVSIFNTNNDHDQEKRVLESILSGHYQGIIIEPTRSASRNPNLNYYISLEKQGIPYVMINAKYDELDPYSVVVDDERGGYIQAEYLIKQGHREIIGIYKSDDAQGQKRLKGYIKAHRNYGVPLNPKNIVTFTTETERDKPIKDVRLLLSSTRDRPTAIACYNDQLLIYLLDIFRENNIKVPEDISVIGYDDTILAEISEVKLTSISHPKSELGSVAARMIVDLIEGKKEVASKVYIPELVERQSTRNILDKLNI